MSTNVKIKDGWGGGNSACVTPRGQLITAPLDFSKVYNAEANVVNTAFNLVTPKRGKQFVMTGLIVYANKGVGANDATVVIYEADSENSLISTEVIFTQEMLKQTTIVMTGLNIISKEGVWINVKTDDDTIFVNLSGYYVSEDN